MSIIFLKTTTDIGYTNSEGVDFYETEVYVGDYDDYNDDHFKIESVLSLGDIDQLFNVNITSAANNHFLTYDNSTSKWINKQPSAALASLGLTATAAEINYLDITTLGTSEASKALTVNASGDLIVPDGDKFQFGTGLDMTMYHDGTDSYITNSTGALKIATETSGVAIQIGHGTSEVTIGDNLTVTGNLIVNGTTTTVNSTVTTLDDPIITLGGDTAPSSDDNKDRGVEFRWHNGSAAKVGFFGYDDSSSKFTFIPDATNTAEVFSGTAGDVSFGAADFAGTVTTTSDLVIDNAKSLKLSELDSNGSHTVSIKAPDSVTADVTLVLPDGTGSPGQALTTNGSGALSWSTVSGGVTSSDITGQTAKTTVHNDDLVLIADSQNSNNLKKMTRANFVDGLTANKTYSSKTATFTAAVNYHYSVNTTSGAVNINLPQLSTVTAGESLVVKFISGTNFLTMVPYSGNTIEGLNNMILTDSQAPGQSVTLVANGSSAWEII